VSTPGQPPELRVFPTAAPLFEAAAAQFSELALASVARSGRFTVALSGGSTPRALYELIAAQYGNSLPWDYIYFFWGDERHVPPDHAESNYRMAREALLSRIPVREQNVFRIKAEEGDADLGAQLYEQSLRRFFPTATGEFPQFDLIHLGMGPDGHTASLFPGTAALHETQRWCVANWVGKFRTYRITLTVPVLNRAACVSVLVSGSGKAEILRNVLEQDSSGEDYPVTLIRPATGKLVWMLDQDAAGALTSST
jgi:6-phosphogluconolactonase